MPRQDQQPEPEPAEPGLEATAGPSPYSQTGSVAPAGAVAGGEVAHGGAAPTESGAPTEPAPATGNSRGKPAKPKRGPRQTLAGRVWIAIAVAVVLLVLVIIFIAENTRSITINFVGLHGHISEALALLIAVIVGVVITLLVGSTRILQLSLEVRKHRKRLKELGEL
jgi:uncharacterized integral membrane protein